MQSQAGKAAGDGVEDPRREPAPEGISPPRLPAGDEVEPFVELRQEAWDLGRVVLQIAVDRDHELTLRLLEPRLESGRLAEVPSQAHDANVGCRRV